MEINGESRAIYINNQIRIKTSMLRSGLCDYIDTYILSSGNITIDGAEEDDTAKWLEEGNKGVKFKNCAAFIDCMSELNNTQIGQVKDLDAAMPMYYSIENGNNYWKPQNPH